MSKKSATPRLLYADSESCADMFYFCGVFVPDAFIAIEDQGARIGVANQLEYTRVKRDALFDEVIPWEALREAAARHYKTKAPQTVDLICELARQRGIKAFKVPYGFPAGLAGELKRRRLKITPQAGSFFPERVCKSSREAEFIRQGNAASAAGLRAAEQALRAATIGPRGKLILDGKPLTSERLRTRIEAACLQRGALARHTICAGGRQACDPHEGGHGPLHAHELIIIDIFPRVTQTGYHGDMTRTYLKGRASEAQRKLVATVKAAHGKALAALKAGVSGKTVHRAAADCLSQAGYETAQSNGRWEGFIHGTGHGLGLEVHEEPRLSPRGQRLRKGMVVTIEPGLYYQEIGGCRIEDVAWITSGGHEPLSRHPYRWEIR